MTENSLFIDEGFEPLLGKDPKVLILGTMPSVQSLKTQEYYGNPRNAFWWIMSKLCCFDSELPYSKRVDRILENHVAVWDVIASCHRPGSLDSKIDQSTVTPNCLSELLKTYPSIRSIIFNGQASEKLFNKFIDDTHWQGKKLTLPSTSPANAALTKEDKLKKWLVIKHLLSL